MKAKKSVESVSIAEHISRVVISLQEQGRDIIDPDYVANVVESRIDVHQVSPHLTKHLAIMQLKQETRQYLRHAIDPVQIVADKLESGQEDLFNDLLQDHYPAKREIMGEDKSVYVARDLLTSVEVEIVAAKMEKASDALSEHAKALRAWHQSR